MAQNILKMKYHPAKKEVEFEALQDGTHFSNYTDSTLYLRYENEPFVLQQHGNAFFEAIKELFNGAGHVSLEVTATRTDYEDLEQMVEYYNRELAHRGSSFRLLTTLKSALPDMDSVYKRVRDYGEEAIAILEHHRTDFYTIASDNQAVRESIKLFADDMQKEIDTIRDKVNRMDGNNVNLCFAGIYSAGKSSLINAILGRRILPERIEPTTARSFRIRSPMDGENVHIEFYLGGEPMTLAWSEESSCLSFTKSLAENASITAINDLLEKNRDTRQHEQIYQVLDYINTDDSVAPVIDVVFPIPLDRETVRFTILDTPGTDSNTIQHGEVLRNALKEQESSILIFVAKANHATDGQGNQDLLDILQNEGKAIDIDRSLFVLNYADCVDSEARKILKSSKIRAKDSGSEDCFEIDLMGKKVFFTSAKAAYIAKAVQNNVATKEETKKFKTLYSDAVDEEFGCYYQDNHCATSDCATDKMLKRCQTALKGAEGDQCQELLICSGLFALEDEIVRYGEKYASAVRAHAIIDGVDRVLVKLGGKASSLAAKTDASIDAIDSEISKIKDFLEKAINKQTKKFYLDSPQHLTADATKELHIDSDRFGCKVITPSTKSIKKQLKGVGAEVTFSEKQRDKIAEIVSQNLLKFEEDYVKQRQKKLKEIQEDFIANVRRDIQKNGEISPEARDFICEITPPQLKEVEFKVKEIKNIYNTEKRNKPFFLFFNKEYLNKKEFLNKLDDYFRQTLEEICSDYRNEFTNTLNSLISTTSDAYTSNLENYSVLLHAKIMDRQAMEELLKKIGSTAQDLKDSAEKLNQMIWEVNNET